MFKPDNRATQCTGGNNEQLLCNYSFADTVYVVFLRDNRTCLPVSLF